MKLPIYHVDAFVDRLFAGNPAAVCPLQEWLADGLMQKIAMENNLSETAFFVPHGRDFQLRWFTPAVEVDLCGHATLAAGHVLFTHLHQEGDEIRFYTRSGIVGVRKGGNLMTLDLPADTVERVKLTPELAAGFNIMPIEAFRGRTDYMLIFRSEKDVVALKLDMKRVSALDARGVIVTARGESADFVSRFFAPRVGIDEDPVTGSAHATLTPYWAKMLAKDRLTAIQFSARRGYLECKYLGSRVEIGGKARTHLTGEIEVDL